MRRLRLVLAAAMLAVACSSPPPTTPKPEDPLIGILRDDGTLLPFARYVNGAWQPAVPGENTSSPGSLAELGTRPAAWFASHRGAIFSPWFGQLRDGPRVTLRARQIVSTDNHCEKNWGISTDFPARPAERRGAIGVATTAPYRWDAFEDWPRSPDTAESEAIRMFDREEEDALVTRGLQGTAPALPPTDTRAGTFVALDVVRRSSQTVRGVRWSYLEATRTYARPDAPQCPLISLFKVWVANEPRGVRTAERSMDLTDCDRKGTISSMPLGMVTIDDRSFVVTVDRGYEDDRYSIIQLAPEFRRVLTVAGGGC
jgi:hypothetical protein